MERAEAMLAGRAPGTLGHPAALWGGLAEVAQAIHDALHLGTVSFDAVKHLLLCRMERRPPRLDLMQYPHLPQKHQKRLWPHQL